MGRFVQPAEVILKISQGDTLTVRRRLNVGEVRARLDRMTGLAVDPDHPGYGKRVIDPLKVDTAVVLAYLLDWSLTDDDGRRIPIRDLPPDQVIATLDQLEADDFDEIKHAIAAHEQAGDAADAEKKRMTAGVIASSTISTSPDAAAGAMSGSLN